MNLNGSMSSAYEQEADRLRAGMGETINELRLNLRPSNLVEEAARGVGVEDWSPAGAYEFASKRHPFATALIALGVGLWAFSVMRKQRHHGSISGMKSSLQDTAAALAQSAADVFRVRAEAKRQKFVGVAQSHITTGASKLADAIERKLEDVINIVPRGSGAHPLIEAAVQSVLSAAVEGMLQNRLRHRWPP